MKFTFSLCTAKDPIQKTVSLNKKTGKLHKEPPSYFPSEFKAQVKETDFKGFAKILAAAKPNQFLIHGVPPEEKVRVVTKAKKEKKALIDKDNVVSRSGEYFSYPVGNPGLFMIDVDNEGYDLDDILQILAEVHTPFATAGYACIQSSSSNIRTKKRILSQQKWHIYFVAEEGQDLERFAKTLFERAVLSGYGNIFIAKDGKQHIRTFFDLSVIAPYRIDFIAPPVCKSPVYQEHFEPESSRGSFLDTLSLKNTSPKDKKRYDAICRQLREETKDEAKKVKEAHIGERIEDYISKTGSSFKKAEEIVQARYVDEEEVRLHFEDLITFEDGDEETIFVKDIIQNVDDYVGRSVRDPLEPDYGENKAKIYLSSGRLLINSFVHGGRKFILSGNTTLEYDTDNNAKIVGFRLDASVVNGGWSEEMLKNWCKIKDGEKVKYARVNSDYNKFIPVPEKGTGLSGMFEIDPIVTYDFKNFVEAMPNVDVVTGWDTKESKPLEEHLGYAFTKLPDIPYKEGGITIAEPSPEIDEYFLNGWLGFPVKPKRNRIHKVIDKYFEEFIEYENEAVYEYFWAYIYHMFQHPFEKPGTAILFQSVQGTGKGTFIQLLSSLIGPVHSGFIDKMDSLTGRFNDIIKGKLLLYADEITFGGYHQANNVLKKIISDEYLTVEAKYKATQRIANVSRFFFSTNEQWALNIERGDRRFFVPRVSTTFLQDTEFFSELRFQWNRNYEAVMNRFMSMEINVDISKPVMTKDKQDLIDVSMHSIESFFKEILMTGNIHSYGVDFADDLIINGESSTEIPVNQIYSIYQAYHNRNFARQGEVATLNIFWKEVYSFFGGQDQSGILKKGRTGTDKHRVILPGLERLRLLWDESHNSNDFT